MSTVLVLTSSALGEASTSNQLVREAVAQLQTENPNIRIVLRDLGSSTNSTAISRGSGPVNAAQAAALALSDELVAELRAADIVVIGAPMYNFGISSTLKAWFDHVLRAGVTFRYTDTGPEGLVKGKRAIVIETRDGLYSEGPAQAMDSQEPHLRTLLGFMGISDLTFVRAEKLAFGPEARELALEAARDQLGGVTRGYYLQAA